MCTDTWQETAAYAENEYSQPGKSFLFLSLSPPATSVSGKHLLLLQLAAGWSTGTEDRISTQTTKHPQMSRFSMMSSEFVKLVCGNCLLLEWKPFSIQQENPAVPGFPALISFCTAQGHLAVFIGPGNATLLSFSQ